MDVWSQVKTKTIRLQLTTSIRVIYQMKIASSLTQAPKGVVNRFPYKVKVRITKIKVILAKMKSLTNLT